MSNDIVILFTIPLIHFANIYAIITLLQKVQKEKLQKTHCLEGTQTG